MPDGLRLRLTACASNMYACVYVERIANYDPSRYSMCLPIQHSELINNLSYHAFLATRHPAKKVGVEDTHEKKEFHQGLFGTLLVGKRGTSEGARNRYTVDHIPEDGSTVGGNYCTGTFLRYNNYTLAFLGTWIRLSPRPH